ncbi:trypsin-like peptidase domain-containing protein [Adhaeribacter swui]|uniref:Trypsin-like peptidase domain-containing protein n=1 Tax=Adhaeribacter swui TaxID=2086471 RepID=A0A7G7G2X1_9BACT|nr:trypsin-like peptidase domain-containing protein [Adhaeribacter swui]QNF31505.1 trypsin-like peptidase domain-containing protein [Adhaeribacter swui]
MTERETFVLIERYLAGELNRAEEIDFDQHRQNDPVFAERYRDYQELFGAMHVYKNRTALKQKLQTIHTTEFETVPETTEAVEPVTSSWKIFWNQHFATMAVAASVAVITVFGSLLSLDAWRSVKKQQNARYSELRREVDQIKRSQRALIQDISGKPSIPNAKLALRPASFIGTGFVLSSSGYFVTSYHVIKDADSVYIENNKGLRYKVKEVYKDKLHDLAILKIADSSFTSFGHLPYAFKSSTADLGEKVYTLGFPREDMVYGEGSLSSRTGFEGDSTAYQISIPVNPGNSGGPLIDSQGNLIGIISGKQREQEGAAFAIKSAYLKTLIQGMGQDTLKEPINLSRRNNLAGLARTQQIKKLQDYVFMVKIYN